METTFLHVITTPEPLQPEKLQKKAIVGPLFKAGLSGKANSLCFSGVILVYPAQWAISHDLDNGACQSPSGSSPCLEKRVYSLC